LHGRLDELEIDGSVLAARVRDFEETFCPSLSTANPAFSIVLTWT
jgi:hypothetical protein